MHKLARTGSAIAFGLFLYLGTALPSLAAPEPFAPDGDIFNLVNSMRSENGIPSVRFSPTLANIAHGRSDDMTERHYFSHTLPGCDPAVFGRCNMLGILDHQRFPYLWAGEILEWNYFLTRYDGPQSDVMAIDDFLHSPAHRDIMLDPRFTDAGAGVVVGPDQKMVVTVLFTQAPAAG